VLIETIQATASADPKLPDMRASVVREPQVLVLLEEHPQKLPLDLFRDANFSNQKVADPGSSRKQCRGFRNLSRQQANAISNPAVCNVPDGLKKRFDQGVLRASQLLAGRHHWSWAVTSEASLGPESLERVGGSVADEVVASSPIAKAHLPAAVIKVNVMAALVLLVDKALHFNIHCLVAAVKTFSRPLHQYHIRLEEVDHGVRAHGG
jgi:hypothetical protein